MTLSHNSRLHQAAGIYLAGVCSGLLSAAG